MSHICDACPEGVKNRHKFSAILKGFQKIYIKSRLNNKLSGQKIDFMITYSFQITLFLNNEFGAPPSNMKVWKSDHVSIQPHSHSAL